jgi:hypothetical protein
MKINRLLADVREGEEEMQTNKVIEKCFRPRRFMRFKTSIMRDYLIYLMPERGFGEMIESHY